MAARLLWATTQPFQHPIYRDGSPPHNNLVVPLLHCDTSRPSHSGEPIALIGSYAIPMQRHFKILGNPISIRVVDPQKKPNRMVSLLTQRGQFTEGGCVVATWIVTLAQPQNQTRRDWRDIRTRTRRRC